MAGASNAEQHRSAFSRFGRQGVTFELSHSRRLSPFGISVEECIAFSLQKFAKQKTCSKHRRREMCCIDLDVQGSPEWYHSDTAELHCCQALQALRYSLKREVREQVLTQAFVQNDTDWIGCPQLRSLWPKLLGLVQPQHTGTTQLSSQAHKLTRIQSFCLLPSKEAFHEDLFKWFCFMLHDVVSLEHLNPCWSGLELFEETDHLVTSSPARTVSRHITIPDLVSLQCYERKAHHSTGAVLFAQTQDTVLCCVGQHNYRYLSVAPIKIAINTIQQLAIHSLCCC